MVTSTIKSIEVNDKIINVLFNQIEEIILINKKEMCYQINNTLVNTYFNIGKVIVEIEQNGNIRAEYGKEVLKRISKKLTNKYGSGFSLSGLYNMRLFYIKYEKCQPLAGKLLLKIILYNNKKIIWLTREN